MGWLILSGAPGAAGYDADLQLIRHNGTTGESAAFPVNNPNGVPSSSGATLTWTSPYVFIGFAKGDPVTVRYVVDRAAFSSWPVLTTPTQAIGAGDLGIVGKVYGDGASFHTCVKNYLTNAYQAYISFDGVTFYTRYSFANPGTFGINIAKGQNNRYLFFSTGGLSVDDIDFVYTDNYIDFISAELPLDTLANHYLHSVAGTSNGIWAFCTAAGSTYKTYYSNDNLVGFNSIVSPSLQKVWAYDTTLYGTIGGRVYSSIDGSTWTDRGLPFGNANIAISDITYDKTSVFLLVGALGYAVTTTDFTTYTPLPGYNFASHGLVGAVYVPDATLYPDAVLPGTATIEGTLRLDTSDGAFAARKVYLYSYTTGAKVAETVSSAVTGIWQFTQVAPGEYFVVGAAQGDDLNIPRDFDALGVITVV